MVWHTFCSFRVWEEILEKLLQFVMDYGISFYIILDAIFH